jgi:hypothetical protein
MLPQACDVLVFVATGPDRDQMRQIRLAVETRAPDQKWALQDPFWCASVAGFPAQEILSLRH